MKSSQKFAERMGDAQTRYVQAYLEGWEGYLSLVSDLTRNAGSPENAQRRYTKYLAEEAPAAISKVGVAAMQVYSAVLEAGSDLTQQFYSVLAGTQRQSPEPAAPKQRPTGKPNDELAFAGYTGEKPRKQFTVSNRTSSPLNVSFELSDFIADDGEQVRAPVEITPDLFALQPAEEKPLDVCVPISSCFSPGKAYRAILRVRGLPEMRMVLRVTNFASAPDAGSPEN